MPPLATMLDLLIPRYTGWIVVFALLTAFELLNGRERHSLRGRISGIAYWMVLIAATTLMNAMLEVALRVLGIRPLMTLPAFHWLAWTGPFAVLLAAMVGAIVHDFFFYWFHRAQHRWLWRWHAVHHSVRELNAVNSYHHISEALVSMFLLQLPVSLILVDSGRALPVLTFLLFLQIVWIHSPTRFHLGPLRCVVADNRFHRIHHSLEERHFDKNFGGLTTIWDRVFGTCHMPEKNEWPDVGLAEVGQPSGMRQWIDLPIRYTRIVDTAQPAAARTAPSSDTVPAT